jgi:hypothetical protein
MLIFLELLLFFKRRKLMTKLLKQSSKEDVSVPAASQTSTQDPSADYESIATAAYFIAEKNGFDETRNLENWLEAEQQLKQSSI